MSAGGAGDHEALCARARAAADSAYARYSGFAVGAAAAWEDGAVSAGVNVENASYPLSVCAERNAVAAGVTAGARRLRALAVWADVDGAVVPCGGCLQVLAEFMDAAPGGDVVLLLGGRSGWERASLRALLPRQFGREA